MPELCSPRLSPAAVDQCTHVAPCANGGTCSVVGSTLTCTCPGTWTGERCQTGAAGAALLATETGETLTPATDSGGTEPIALTARSVPGVQGTSAQQGAPLGTQASGTWTLGEPGAESPGPHGVEGRPESRGFSPYPRTRANGSAAAGPWTEPFTTASPDGPPRVSSGAPEPAATPAAPAPRSPLLRGPLTLAPDALPSTRDSRPSPASARTELASDAPASTSGWSWKGGGLGASVAQPATDRTAVPGPETMTPSDRSKEPEASTPPRGLAPLSTDPPALASRPATQYPQGPGAGGSHGVATSSLPPVSSAPRAAPALPSPRATDGDGDTSVTATLHQETAHPGTPRTTAALPPGPGTPRASAPQGSFPPAAPEPRGSPTSASERGLLGSPPVPGPSTLSSSLSWSAATAGPATAASPSASRRWSSETARPVLELSPGLTSTTPRPSSPATEPAPPSSAAQTLPGSSSTPGAQPRPRHPVPKLASTAESTGSLPRPAATGNVPRTRGPPPARPASSTGTAAPGAGTRLGDATPAARPGPAGVTEAPAPAGPAGDGHGTAQRVFVVEDQPPLLKAHVLRVPCELVLEMELVPALQDPASREHQGLVQSFNETVAPLFAAVPGFQRLEVKRIGREQPRPRSELQPWPGGAVLEYDALFALEQGRWPAPGVGALLNLTMQSGLRIANASVLRGAVLETRLDPCALLFACPAGFECVGRGDGNASCTSVCHRDYCKNHGICTHPRGREPVCQCPVGSDYWFMGLRCDYKVTHQGLLGAACGVLLSVALVGAVIAGLVIRRVKTLLLEAKVDQTKSSYRRFCRLDDVSAQYWSQSWLASANSLDNPAFCPSEEVLHLQVLDNSCCSCKDDSLLADSCKPQPTPPLRAACQPSFQYDWETSSSSMNDPMIDSGKASDISVSSWPMEPIQWTPFPLLHQLSRQRPHKARRPHSYCEGMELVNLERSWTA
ncbi:nascent polypeptide-associated complex subunit alpha, muscle-specific form-like [Alligator sinensis]|uniref:Nascent polypeptide-associated complex subunit alpha, muscle-specific form-like n=1 Tax=Alligator sinensis TaxID=38654 RepID=A0A3Q0GW71_ALLSI|nr:nascent polypeptide-associated complex subunit alpha, muscle-specific form-like [Alligator sinensis]